MRVDAPAKLNLSLRVVGRREDGFHDLESELVLLELADRLLLMPGSSGLRVEGTDAHGVPHDGSNLAWRGLVAGLGHEPDHACLTVEKRIPAAAGLGGGSSDAAAAWRLGRASRGTSSVPTGDELRGMAAIGADVPFFAAGAARARVTGIGEVVEPLDSRARRSVVLVHPPFTLETAAVFAALRPEDWGRAENDLLAPARRLRPELDELAALVAAAGGEPRLTGSGPTLFTLSDDPERASDVANRVAEAGVRTTVTHTRVAAASIELISEEEA